MGRVPILVAGDVLEDIGKVENPFSRACQPGRFAVLAGLGAAPREPLCDHAKANTRMGFLFGNGVRTAFTEDCYV